MALGEIKAGRAFVEIIAKDQTKAGVSSALGSLKGLAGGLASAASMVSTAIAAISSSAIIGAAKHFADVGSAINDMSIRTGVSAQRLQILRFAAKQSGASLQDVEAALRTMAKNGKDVGQFESLGKKLAAIADPAQRSAAFLDEFGKAGTRLIPMFSEFNSLKAASDALGPVLTSEEVKAADALGDAMGALQEAASRAAQQVGAKLAPALQDSLEIATGLTVEFSKWVSGNQQSGGLVDAIEGILEKGGGGLLGMLYSDRIAEFLRGSERAGEAGLAPANTGAADASEAKTEAELEAKKKAEEAAKKAEDDFFKGITDGIDKAKRTIDQFKTPAEQFADKLKEMSEAVNAVNRGRLTGQLSEQEAASLTNALKTSIARAQADESAKNMKARSEPVRQIMGNLITPLEKLRQQFAVIQQALRVEQNPANRRDLAETMARLRTAINQEASSLTSLGSRGTFSATGAGQLGFGSRSIQKTDDKNAPIIVRELVGIRQEVGKIVPVFR